MTDALIKGGPDVLALFVVSVVLPGPDGEGRCAAVLVVVGGGDGNQTNKAEAPAVGTGCLLNKHRLGWQQAHHWILAASANGLVMNSLWNPSFPTGVHHLPSGCFPCGFVIVRWIDG